MLDWHHEDLIILAILFVPLAIAVVILLWGAFDDHRTSEQLASRDFDRKEVDKKDQ